MAENTGWTPNDIKQFMDYVEKSSNRSKLLDRVDNIRLSKLSKNTEDLKKEIRKTNKQDRKTAIDIARMTSYTSVLVDQAIDSKDNVKKLDKLFKAMTKEYKSQLSMGSPNLAAQISDISDVFKFQDMAPRIVQFQELLDSFISKNGFDKIDEEANRLAAAMGVDVKEILDINKFKTKMLDSTKKIESKLGITFKDMGIDLERIANIKELEHELAQKGVKLEGEWIEELNQSKKELEKFKRAIFNAEVALAKTAGGGNIVSKSLNLVGEGAKSVAAKLLTVGLLASGIKDVYDAIKAAGRFGVALDPVTGALTGLTLQELPELQARFKQTALSIGGMDNFNQILLSSMKESNSEFVLLAGGLSNASRSMASMIDNVRSFGSNLIDNTKAVADEISMFKRFQVEMGMTTDQFNDLTTELVNDSDVRNQLMRLNMNQRKAYMDNIRLMMLENHERGMTIEQSKAATKALAGIAGMSPKERMKMAARTRVMAGALGLQEEGEAFAKAAIAGSRASAEDQAKAARAINKINEAGMAKMGESLGSEFVMSQFMNMPDMSQVFGPNSPFAQEILSSGKAYGKEFAEEAKKQILFGNDELGKKLQEQLGINVKNVGDAIGKAEQALTIMEQGFVLGGYSTAKLAADEVSNRMLKAQTGIDFGSTNSILTGIFDVTENILKHITFGGYETTTDKMKQSIQETKAQIIEQKKKDQEKEEQLKNQYEMMVAIRNQLENGTINDERQIRQMQKTFDEYKQIMMKQLNMNEQQLEQQMKTNSTLNTTTKEARG